MLAAREREGTAAAERLLAEQPLTIGSALVNLADVIRAEESRLLQLRESEVAAMEAGVRKVQIVAGLLAFGLAARASCVEAHAWAARLRAEQELRHANETLERRVAERTRSLRFLADAMPQLVWTTAANGQADSFNRGWCEYAGLTEDASCRGGW